MRIIFMGTGDIALPTLRWLISDQPGSGEHRIVAVYTQPDKPVGRKQILTAPEIKKLAEENGIPVRQPESLKGNDAALREFADFQPDLVVVMAYGQILPQALIQAASLTCLNLHASLLPRHRGASPIQAAIREGDCETGITLMHVVSKLDAGDIILKEIFPIRPDDTGGSLHDRIADRGPGVIARGLEMIRTGPLRSEPQDPSLATYSGKLVREDGEINWNSDASVLERLIRAYDPWPGARTDFPLLNHIRKLKIHPGTTPVRGDDSAPGTVLESSSRLVVNCGTGALILHGELQLEGRSRLPAEQFLRGTAIPVGTILGTR